MGHFWGLYHQTNVRGRALKLILMRQMPIGLHPCESVFERHMSASIPCFIFEITCRFEASIASLFNISSVHSLSLLTAHVAAHSDDGENHDNKQGSREDQQGPGHIIVVFVVIVHI